MVVPFVAIGDAQRGGEDEGKAGVAVHMELARVAGVVEDWMLLFAECDQIVHASWLMIDGR